MRPRGSVLPVKMFTRRFISCPGSINNLFSRQFIIDDAVIACHKYNKTIVKNVMKFPAFVIHD